MFTILIYGGIALFWYLFKMFAKKIVETDIYKRMEEKEQAEISQGYNQAIQSQQSNTPWTIRYAIYPCPHCGHYKVRCANWEDKRLSVAFWGAASSKIGKTYKCEHCKRMW